MAVLYPSQDATMDWSSGDWSVADDNAKNHVAPIDNDTVRITANSSAAITLDADQIDIELAGLDMTGYTGTLTDDGTPRNLDVDGNVVLAGNVIQTTNFLIECSGSMTLTDGMTATGLQLTLDGTGTFTSNNVTVGDLVINTPGTVTLPGGPTGPVNCGAFTFSGGEFDQASQPVTATGDLIGEDPINLTNPGAFTQSGTGVDLKWRDASEKMASYTAVTGSTITRTGYVFADKVTVPEGVTMGADGAANFLYPYEPSANNFCDVQGTINTGKVKIRLAANRSNNTPILCPNVLFYLTANGGARTLTQSAEVQCSSLQLAGNGAVLAKIIFSGAGGRIGAVVLGDAAGATRDGGVEFGTGVFVIDSLGDQGQGANGHVVSVDSAYIQIAGGGTFDAAGAATMSANAGECHIEGLGTAHIDNFNPDAATHCHNCIDDGGNGGNLDFNKHAAPGSLGLLGVGI